MLVSHRVAKAAGDVGARVILDVGKQHACALGDETLHRRAANTGTPPVITATFPSNRPIAFAPSAQHAAFTQAIDLVGAIAGLVQHRVAVLADFGREPRCDLRLALQLERAGHSQRVGVAKGTSAPMARICGSSGTSSTVPTMPNVTPAPSRILRQSARSRSSNTASSMATSSCVYAAAFRCWQSADRPPRLRDRLPSGMASTAVVR